MAISSYEVSRLTIGSNLFLGFGPIPGFGSGADRLGLSTPRL